MFEVDLGHNFVRFLSQTPEADALSTKYLEQNTRSKYFFTIQPSLFSLILLFTTHSYFALFPKA